MIKRRFNRNHSPNSEYEEKAMYYLEGLGGKENIKDVTNCTTRLRLTVKDESKVQESAYFTHNQMSHGLVKVAKVFKSSLECLYLR